MTFTNHTFQIMKKIESQRQTVTASWLTLHTRATKNTAKKPSLSDRVFECKRCNKKFYSFQALGGHRASHKKIRLFTSGNQNQSSSMVHVKRKVHGCSICGLEFPMGQALGGHMRRHRVEVINNNQSADNGFIKVLKKCNSKRILLDLNLTPYENELKLERQDMFSLALGCF